ncbi:MAG: transcriptional regulator [Deltaproteobacteria bacterium GWC2_42_11]|nr:MAG: transcriptional regulator [Deltaproteobacteria bacterium GWC2_42_11]HBO84255.1 YebC/PmpR family DNA-binding transcriptional regulator [Deltaproteobacteria bacterium]
MSGHSRWANIKHKKAKSDAKKGRVFTKVIKEVMVAAKMGGGDMSANPRLRTAIENARAENVPADNINRAIKKGTGELEDVNYEEFFYEGYGAGGTAVLVLIMTDNRNRTASEVRYTFAKYGGRLAESGSVSWMFEKKGMFTFDMSSITEEKLMEAAIDAGAEDVITNTEDNVFEVYTAPPDFHSVKGTFDKKGMKYTIAEVSMIPKNTVRLEGKDAVNVIRLMEELEDLEDVQNVYANFDIPPQDME